MKEKKKKKKKKKEPLLSFQTVAIQVHVSVTKHHQDTRVIQTHIKHLHKQYSSPKVKHNYLSKWRQKYMVIRTNPSE